MKQKILIYLFDGFSDWEIAYLSPEIQKNENFELFYFSIDGKPVRSMGGLKVLPKFSLEEINIDEISMLILPGGTSWEKDTNEMLIPLIQNLWKQQITIAAICAATTFLAKQGFLDNLNHTSNDLYYLKSAVPQYAGEQKYINSLAVTDENIITASGIAPIEFAKEIFHKIKLNNEENIENWFQLFKNGIWKY